MRTIRGVDPLLAVVRHRHRFGVALGLVVDAARADRVHVPPVRLGLRMDLGVAVDLARRREQEACTLPLREAECVMRAVRARLQRVERHPQVVDRAREGGEVVDEVERLVDGDRLDDVVMHEEERVVPEMCDVLERRGLQVVEAEHAMAALEKRLAKVRAEETDATGDERGRHVSMLSTRSGGSKRSPRCAQRLGHVHARPDESSSARSVSPRSGSLEPLRRVLTTGCIDRRTPRPLVSEESRHVGPPRESARRSSAGLTCPPLSEYGNRPRAPRGAPEQGEGIA